MILGIIIFLLFIVIGIVAWKYDGDELSVGCSFLCGTIISGFAIFISFTYWSDAMVTNNKTQLNTIDVQNIYTLQTTTSVEGAFCLGSGYIEGNAYYYYYTKDNNGLYQLNKIEVEKCSLKLSDTETPKCIKQKLVAKRPNWFFAFGDKLFFIETEYYILVVPTNTIQINSFNGMIE